MSDELSGHLEDAKEGTTMCTEAIESGVVDGLANTHLSTLVNVEKEVRLILYIRDLLDKIAIVAQCHDEMTKGSLDLALGDLGNK